MEIENIEPKVAPEIKEEIDRMYEVYFKKTARSNVYHWLIEFNKKNKIGENSTNIRNYIKFNRIGIPDYIFWKYSGDCYFDNDLNNDDE